MSEIGSAAVVNPGDVYLQHLEAISRIANSLCKRSGVYGADAEDFESDVRLRLLENDYAVLRKHRGDSSMATFLTVVIANMFRDYRIRMWGKWRPSTEAKRLGDAAVFLETTMYRDGRSFEDACSQLEQGARVNVDRKALRQIIEKLPVRAPRKIEGEEALAEVAASTQADGPMLDAEQRARRVALHGAIARAIATLDSEDQLIVRLRFYEGFSVADVARALALAQKPLYSRLTRVLHALSTALTRDGIGRQALEFFESP